MKKRASSEIEPTHGPLTREETYGVRYYGERVSKKGIKTKTFLAGNILQLLYSGEAERAFTIQEVQGMIPRDIMDKRMIKEHTTRRNDNKVFMLDFQEYPTYQAVLNYELKSQITDVPENNPLVFLVTSQHHSILYIIAGARLYTIGFGYFGSGKISSEMIPKIRENLSLVPEKKLNKLPSLLHAVDRLEGNLYSTDHLMPSETHSAQISWVGYLTIEMADRLEQDLKTTHFILSDNLKENNYILSLTKQPYLEWSGITEGLTTLFRESPEIMNKNCLTWAQHILGVRLNCGLEQNPALCKEVTEDEMMRLISSMRHGSVALSEVIQSIQNRLTEREHPLSSIYRSSKHYLGKLTGISRGNRNRRRNSKSTTRRRKRKSH